MVYVAPRPVNWESFTHPVRWSLALRCASGRQGVLVVAGLGFAVALVARDLAVPLLIISLFGLFDRFVGEPFIRSHPAG